MTTSELVVRARWDRLRSVGVSLGWIALYVVIGSGVAYVLAQGYTMVGRWHLFAPYAGGASGSWFLASASTFLLIGFGFATWFVGVRLSGHSWGELGWRPRGGIPRQVVQGAGLGAAAAVLAILLTVVFAGASVYFSPRWWNYLGAAGPLGLGLFGAALLEELLFRGFPLRQLADGLGKWPATLVLATGFGLAHVWNDNAGAFGILNIALAGLWLSVAFLSPGGMALAWGLHFGWNFGLALFDAPVSGLSVGLAAAQYRPGSHPWVDGGAFGPEGGLVGTVAIAVGLIVMLGRRVRRPPLWPAA